jgi:hypothetical protein
MLDSVGPAFDYHLRETRKPPAAMDLPSVAKFAGEAADALAEGTRRFAPEGEPRFTQLAGETEAFFRDLERAARRGDGAAAAELVRTGEERHCNRCHDQYQH